ncbi:MAG: serine/threonine protein kinase [Planctomycetes bacterium]|nr:serine/threonine protein kinase [Planctomycetota bacterium]
MGFFDKFLGGGGSSGSTGKLPKETPFFREYEHVQDMLAGAMSSIAKVRHFTSKRLHVIKKVNPQTPEAKRKLQRELEVSFQMQHENVIRFIAWEKRGNETWILMEYVDGPSLRGFLRDQLVLRQAKPPLLSGRDFITVYCQCARALQYVHGKGYLHLDVKPENFLVTGLKSVGETKVDRSKDTQVFKREVLEQAGGISVKLIDFGISMRIDEPKVGVGGSILYVAPEVVGGVQTQSQVGPASDLWSLGATMYEVATGRPPYLPAWFEGKPQHWQTLWNEYEKQDASVKKAYDGDMLKKRISTPVDVSKAPYSDAIRGVLKKCLELPMTRRFTSSAALVSELEKFL